MILSRISEAVPSKFCWWIDWIVSISSVMLSSRVAAARNFIWLFLESIIFMIVQLPCVSCFHEGSIIFSGIGTHTPVVWTTDLLKQYSGASERMHRVQSGSVKFTLAS